MRIHFAVSVVLLSVSIGCGGRQIAADAFADATDDALPGDVADVDVADVDVADVDVADVDVADVVVADLPGMDSPGQDMRQDVTEDADSFIGEVGDTIESACPAFGVGEIAGNLNETPLLEISGLAASRNFDGVLWAHNDSGAAAMLYAIVLPLAGDETRVGTSVVEYTVSPATLVDWEDIATGPFGGLQREALFIADAGDNGLSREFVTIYVVEEPSELVPSTIDVVARFDVQYPDGPHDCESIFVDSRSGDVFLVAKVYDEGVPVNVYRLSAVQMANRTEGVLELSIAGQVPLMMATGADMLADGSRLAVRGYFGGLLYERAIGISVEQMLASIPCELPLFSADPYNEFQGEAIAFDPYGMGFFTASERYFDQNVNFTPLISVE